MISALLFAFALQAATTDPVEQACYDKDHSQMAMNRCAGEAFERADVELNRHWKAVLADSDTEWKTIMIEGQRGWLQYRDNQCEIVAFAERGGSMWPMIISGCRAELTRQRVQQLVDLLSEGD